jgi:hypothetical protein
MGGLCRKFYKPAIVVEFGLLQRCLGNENGINEEFWRKASNQVN